MTLQKLFALFLLAAAASPALAGSESAAKETTAELASPWPEIWGNVGVRGYITGDRMAPNGVEFDPLFRSELNLNIGLLPQKKLYLFVESDFWAQSAAPGVTNENQGEFDFSKREFDVNAGFAVTLLERLELRASGYSMSNLNRGTSRTVPSGYQDGLQFEGRYYFGDASIYDTGRLSFIGVGYYPGHELISPDGSEFRTGLFAQAYATYYIAPLRSYIYGGLKLIGEDDVDLRLVTIDAGVAVRPFDRLRNLEVRIGDEFTADIDSDSDRNLIYAAVRGYWGGGFGRDEANAAPALPDAVRSPEIWGALGLNVIPAGDRMAPNGVEFDPILMSDLTLNFGLLPRKKLYLFTENRFWVQESSDRGLGVDDPATDDFSHREYDLTVGFGWNVWNRFEIRGSAYSMNNLNRGGAENKGVSQRLPSGYQDGVLGELRYYFPSENIYDIGRESFIAVGYFPSQSMIGGRGVGFHPGLFARARGAFEIPRLRSYVYGDATFIGEEAGSPRLITFDAGWAARPFSRFENLEFRIGNEVIADVEDDTTRYLPYGAIRINFSTR